MRTRLFLWLVQRKRLFLWLVQAIAIHELQQIGLESWFIMHLNYMKQKTYAYLKIRVFLSISQFCKHFMIIEIQFQRNYLKMRGSPIGNLRRGQEYSPYDSSHRNYNVSRDQPQTRGHSLAEADYWRAKAHELQSQAIALSQELNIHARHKEKTNDLQEKIELLLAQNTHFVQENQNLIKLVQQKNSEIQAWRAKLNSESVNSSLAEAEKRKVFEHLNIKDQEHQIQIQKLLSQITRLQNEAVDIDNKNTLEMHRLKNQYESQSVAQIQNLRRSQNGNTEIQELNIRKLKDVIQEKNYQIENLTRQLRLKNQEMKMEANYNKNQLKKLDEQKSHQIDLINAEFQNVKNNMNRQHKKSQDELRNLHEAKVKRLTYQIQEKKHIIQEGNAKIKHTGKEGQTQIARLVNDNEAMRNQLKENDNRNRIRIEELTAFYDGQFQKERQANTLRENNLSTHYGNEIIILQKVIQAKEEEIQRILQLNKDMKNNEETRLHQIKQNNYELKSKISDIVSHYERQIELSKIKISQLYEADLQSLRNKLKNSYSNHTLEVDGLRSMLSEARSKVAHQVQQRLDLRKEYELRLTQLAISHEKIQRQLKTVVAQREKQIQGHTSKASLTHISHNQLLQTRNLDMKQIIQEKRVLETHLNSKNKEIQALNLKVQQMIGLHKRDIQKFEQEIQSKTEQHREWLVRQEKQSKEWQSERKDLHNKIEDLNKNISQLKKDIQQTKNSYNISDNQKSIDIAKLQGIIQQLQSKIRMLSSKGQVQVENVERTVLETRTLMNSEKQRFFEMFEREKQLIREEHERTKKQLDTQITDLKKQNQILQDNYRKAMMRQEQLKRDIQGLTDSVNTKAKLEEAVVNVGLSNNYFKNVVEIFKKELSV